MMARKRPRNTPDSDRMDINDPEFGGDGDDFESDQGDISIGSDTYVSSQRSDGSSSDSDELNAELFQEFMKKLIHCCSHRWHCLPQGSCYPGLCNSLSTNDVTHQPLRIQPSKKSIVPLPPQDPSKAAAPPPPSRASPSAREQQQQHWQNSSHFPDIPPLLFRSLVNMIVGICKMQYDALVECRHRRIAVKKMTIMVKKLYAKSNCSPPLLPIGSEAEEEEEEEQLESFDVWMTRFLQEDHYSKLFGSRTGMYPSGSSSAAAPVMWGRVYERRRKKAAASAS